MRFFIDPGDYSPMGGIWFRKLTWSGYDFLDSVRDLAIWRETKEGVKKAGGFTVDIVVAVGKFLIKEKLNGSSPLRFATESAEEPGITGVGE